MKRSKTMVRRGFILAMLLCVFAPTSQAADYGVTIGDNYFNPSTAIVTVGGEVNWLYHFGSATHTVTADDGSFDSPVLSQGGSYQRTFNTAGVYPYRCKVHDAMRGAVEVRAASQSQPSPSPAPSPELSPSPVPITSPVAASAASPRPKASASPSPSASVQPSPSPSPIPAAASAESEAEPSAQASAPSASKPRPRAAATAPQQGPGWLFWVIVGSGVIAVSGIAGIMLARRAVPYPPS